MIHISCVFSHASDTTIPRLVSYNRCLDGPNIGYTVDGGFSENAFKLVVPGNSESCGFGFTITGRTGVCISFTMKGCFREIQHSWSGLWVACILVNVTHNTPLSSSAAFNEFHSRVPTNLTLLQWLNWSQPSNI